MATDKQSLFLLDLVRKMPVKEVTGIIEECLVFLAKEEEKLDIKQFESDMK